MVYKAKRLDGRNRKFVKFFLNNGCDPEKAAISAGWTPEWASRNTDSLLEKPVIQEALTRALSKDGLNDNRPMLYQTLYRCMNAKTRRTVTASESSKRADAVAKIMGKKLSGPEKESQIAELDSALAVKEKDNYQIQMWAADVGYRLLGEYAATTTNVNVNDPFAGKSDAEQDEMEKEADRTMKLIMGGKGRKSA